MLLIIGHMGVGCSYEKGQMNITEIEQQFK